MSKNYYTKIIFEIKDGEKSARFRTELKLPFVPTKETAIRRKDSVAIPLGPFEKVVYDHDDNQFVCWIKPWVPTEGENKDRDIKQAIHNLLEEGWTRIDIHGFEYLLK